MRDQDRDSGRTSVRFGLPLLLLAIYLLALILGYGWWEHHQVRESTDDAYVHGDTPLISSRVPGTVTEVLVEENQYVQRGECLVRLDSAQAKVALSQAETAVDMAGSRLEAACFEDRRDPRFTEFSVEELVGQRIYGLVLGYEDVNDHEELRADPLMAVLVGKEDPLGRDRRAEADRGKACAGKSTLNRLELSSVTQDKYRKTPVNEASVEAFLVEQFIRVRGGKPKELVLDLEATDDPLHGEQEGRFYHGYYRCYCYLPLYVFCEGSVLGAKLRVSNLDGSEGAVEEMERIVGQLRGKWPKVRITLRADSSFAREALMKWCEEHRVDYVFGLARNQRLEGALESELEQAQALQQQSGSSARVYKDFRYQTRKSWTQERASSGQGRVHG